MKNLKNLNLIETLNEEVLVKKKPILGICLGCQLLLNSSEEGEKTKGLGWIEGTAKKFTANYKFPKTHVGWNQVKLKKVSFFEKMPRDFLMYFNYSYNFSSIFYKENIFGIQPHPEKSQKFGIEFLRNFLNNVS